MGSVILGIGFIVVGLAGGLGVAFGWLAPMVQTAQLTEKIGQVAAAVICIIAAVALIIAGILKLAGVW